MCCESAPVAAVRWKHPNTSLFTLGCIRSNVMQWINIVFHVLTLASLCLRLFFYLQPLYSHSILLQNQRNARPPCHILNICFFTLWFLTQVNFLGFAVETPISSNIVDVKGVAVVRLNRLLHTSHPFPCAECGEAFKRRKELDLHSLMHQGKTLTFIAHPCSSRSNDTHDASTAVARVLIYLQRKLNICRSLICGCLHLHMMYWMLLSWGPGGFRSMEEKIGNVWQTCWVVEWRW